MDIGIAGRRALICGASAGLGFACAKALAAEGVHVTLVSRSEERLQHAAQLLSVHATASVDWKVADLSIAEDRHALVESFPQTDILITNAGGPPALPYAELDLARWHKALEQNFLSAFDLIHGFLPGMTERRFGRIVNITSASVKTPVVNLELSTGARMALTGYVAGVSRQVAKFNVAINNLLPGTILTDRVRELGAVAERMIADVPAERAGTPEEFAAACAFLCSDAAGFIVGQNLCVDGGLVRSTV
ncbi:short-chain dehydrogenase/reductase SDR [Zymomonas mobilis subsp. mobilis ZM4 = ATCC 31821]|uniref:Short-chain dehydrogenase/reductase SDR n=1 Tax=Zymomonas mobilis subsp. mobilis (strain ATCC 31821 / ZM4 / CP4) TaxID=264203 RepID=Q5NL40_ZYMMO|nr:SDR family oxidoreductase [Zymomonas mobilis]AAV90570.1 short-chain dehydrogenase/reductase SDR [Zymomonas mobilis subsp. mobilis ZM4 = ATCC 31821]AVZ26746.1 short-chain dehydrogenase/reductase SDR [Zymomonas mobilis subsp. mobilis]AVZ28632.1 short-chain dehydrogenase/reductase SDR [Zymomonas mobilis subsp. mobilis]AVZ43078.1 short-chain dehydrogenase/reductase SDR [Zymomonas mobilis subsp. mobilis ZM4 = ATCC 31821]UBQ07826.1 SDR family oxidoreductase [Zymomonas mobilis]